MDILQITGGRPLYGTVTASGAKNAALPIMAAAILADEPVTLDRVPRLRDVATLSNVLEGLGMSVRRQCGGSLRIETLDDEPIRADQRLVRRMRASFCVLGPLLARRGRGVVPLPGGCRIGDRPVDLHLSGLAALGADIRLERGWIVAEARRLRGAKIHLSGSSGPTVTGTANVMSAATLARGATAITGAAREPEIVDLAEFLTALGARIEGAGSPTIHVRGVESLGGAVHRIIPDRIETATLLLAGAIAGGEVTISDCRPRHLAQTLALLDEAGCALQTRDEEIALSAPRRPRALKFDAAPHPGVPTDVQAQFTAFLALADGTSRIGDRVFPERFAHLAELRRLGADVHRDGSSAVVRGIGRLEGAEVAACDLRASAALVLAALAAQGETKIRQAWHLARGYERLDKKLAALGANVSISKQTGYARV